MLPLVRILSLVSVLLPAGVRFPPLRLFGLSVLLTILSTAGRRGLFRECLTGCQYSHHHKSQCVLRFHGDFLFIQSARAWHSANL